MSCPRILPLEDPVNIVGRGSVSNLWPPMPPVQMLPHGHTGLLYLTLPNKPWFISVSMYKSFENTVGKGEIASYKQFLLFPQCFTLLKNFPVFIKFKIVVCKFFKFGSLKFVYRERVKTHFVYFLAVIVILIQ